MRIVPTPIVVGTRLEDDSKAGVTVVVV